MAKEEAKQPEAKLPADQPAASRPAARQSQVSQSQAEQPEEAIGDFVRRSLQGTKFERLADALAEEFGKTNLTKDRLHNAPLKIRVTHGADIYQVIAVLQKKVEEEKAAQEAAEEKKAGGKS